MKQKQTDISVIVVSFNTSKLLDTCLTLLEAQRLGEYTMEIIVVDNGSTDGSPDTVKKKHPDIKLVKLDENKGFAAANNIGIRVSAGRFILPS